MSYIKISVTHLKIDQLKKCNSILLFFFFYDLFCKNNLGFLFNKSIKREKSRNKKILKLESFTFVYCTLYLF